MPCTHLHRHLHRVMHMGGGSRGMPRMGGWVGEGTTMLHQTRQAGDGPHMRRYCEWERDNGLGFRKGLSRVQGLGRVYLGFRVKKGCI
jgi:hypothetical protein